MSDCPPLIDGADVLGYAVLGKEQHPTGRTKHFVGHSELPPFAALAIAQYEGSSSCYLFRCDETWATMTDTFHETREAAFKQAEWEYEGLLAAWVWVR